MYSVVVIWSDMAKTKNELKQSGRRFEAEERVSVALPNDHIYLVKEIAWENERTIPAQMRLIVREWYARQQTAAQ